jgi:hypothetical protein
MQSAYSYAETLEISQRINWKIEDLIGGDKRLDFGKPFLPDSLAATQAMKFLRADERLILNQIRGHGYLYIFGLVEEFILPFLLDHTRPQLSADDTRTRALLQFAGEEAKHIQLFKRFRTEFTRDFGHECEVIGPPEAIAQAVLAHPPLAVALVILQIEWMTQRHYLDSIRDDNRMDPMFKSLLKHHWMEEAQHAKLDTLIVEAIVARSTPAENKAGFAGYLSIGGLVDSGLLKQVELDMASFMAVTGRKLTEEDQAGFKQIQHKAMRWTILGSGMTHPRFRATLGQIDREADLKLETIAPMFC